MTFFIDNPFDPSKKNILIVEDSFKILSYLAEHFLDKYNVKACSDYKSAAKIVSSKWPDILLTDEKLPDGSGLDLAKASKKGTQNVKAVIFTGNSSETLAIEAINAKVDYFFVKPIIFEEVFSVINELNCLYDKNHQKILTLTKREIEIFELILIGLNAIKISQKLNISLLTVRTHFKNIYTKLNCRGTEEIFRKYKI
jgi:DNA-binding NarL/FixJ family response regulator